MTTNDLIRTLKEQGIFCSNSRLSPAYKRRLDADETLLKAVLHATSYLEYDAPLAVRLKCLQLLILEQPRCATCSSAVYMATSGPRIHTFPKYCSSKCFSGLSSVVRARQQTCMDRYDATSYVSSEDGVAQRAATLLERYGVDNAAKIDGAAEKRKLTMLSKHGSLSAALEAAKHQRNETIIEKYGSIERFNAYVSSKQQQAMVEKYGVDNAFKVEAFQQRARQTKLEKYGDSSAIRSDEVLSRKAQTMIERYGHAHYWSSRIPESTLTTLNDRDMFAQLIATMTTADLAVQLGVSQSTIRKTIKHHGLKKETDVV